MNGEKKNREYCSTDKWEVPLKYGLFCGSLLAGFFSITLTRVVHFGDFIDRYFEDPLNPDGVLSKEIGIDRWWKLVLLILGMVFLNFLSFYVSIKYSYWRWNNVFGSNIGKKVGKFTLLIFSFCSMIIELFLTTVAIANIFISFTNYLMLASVAFAHGLVIFKIGLEDKPFKKSSATEGDSKKYDNSSISSASMFQTFPSQKVHL